MDRVCRYVDTYPDRPICGYVEAILPAAGSEFAMIPPDNATGNFTKTVRRFTVGIRFYPRDTNAALARPGMSVETAVAVSAPDNASPTERGTRVGCSFDPSKDKVERTLTKLPEHPGLGRARPQGTSGIEVPFLHHARGFRPRKLTYSRCWFPATIRTAFHSKRSLAACRLAARTRDDTRPPVQAIEIGATENQLRLRDKCHDD